MPDSTHRTIDRGVARLTQALKAFDPNQPRADDGKWTDSGSATHDTSNHTEEDEAFVAKFGKDFVPAMNHIWDEYNVSSSVLEDIQNTIKEMTPDELVNFVQKNYLGEELDDEDVAKEWLDEQAFWSTLPAAIRDNLDLSSVGHDLQKDGGEVVSFYDTQTETTHFFKLPKKA